jgi:two-component system nitrate/nitrite sensor histidine kinase NarX
VEGKQPLACYDAQTDPRANYEFCHALGIRSVLEVPCMLRGRVLAIAVVFTLDEPRTFSEEQIGLACGIADAVAPAIENARLYREVAQMAVLEERTRLAREIHDDLAQSVALLRMKAADVERELTYHRLEGAREDLLAMQELLSETSVNVREAVFNLRSTPLLAERLLPRLRDYLASYRTSFGVNVQLEAEVEEEFALSGAVAVQLMHIIQEALTNTRRHARATRVWVRLQQQGEHLQVTINDNGRGFDAVQIAGGSSHFGLQVMQDRAHSVGGNIAFQPRPGGGTQVLVEVPLVFRREAL